MISFLKVRAVQVILILTTYFLLSPYLSPAVHQGFYTISLFIKDLLVWILPVTVGLFIAHAISSFQRYAPLFVITLILFEALSNLSSVWYVFGAGHLSSNLLPSLEFSNISSNFEPLWRLPFTKPAWWGADKGSFAGLILGSVAALTSRPFLKDATRRGKEIAEWILTRIFSRLIPLFVLGFVARMQQTNLLHNLISHYMELLAWLVVILALYIATLFLLGSGGSFAGALRSFKNLLPAGALAFTSGCSLSTMPWTIQGTAKNLNSPDLAKAVIPATTNIQQIGDCIANTFLCFLLYQQFYGHFPDLATWFNFSIVFVLARFATAAIIGGAIFIMLPIYENYLSFNPEMIAIILAFNVILDPLITSTNVIANGALCRIFEKAWSKVQLRLARSLQN